MRSRLLPLLFAFLIFLSAASVTFASGNGDITVYKGSSKGVECYHRYGCSYLNMDTAISLTLQRAVDQGLRACSRCKPAVLNDPKTGDDEPYHAGYSSSDYNTAAGGSGLRAASVQSPSNSGTSQHNNTAVSAADPAKGAESPWLYAGGGILAGLFIRGRIADKEDERRRAEERKRQQQEARLRDQDY